MEITSLGGSVGIDRSQSNEGDLEHEFNTDETHYWSYIDASIGELNLQVKKYFLFPW